ncbi:hypothetical protein S83_032937, partial [Arachis hypogaea]
GFWASDLEEDYEEQEFWAGGGSDASADMELRVRNNLDPGSDSCMRSWVVSIQTLVVAISAGIHGNGEKRFIAMVKTPSAKQIIRGRQIQTLVVAVNAGIYCSGSMKRYSEKTTELSKLGTPNAIRMEIVELMAKNQYERCLPDVENRSSKLEKSTVRRKAQITSAIARHETR